MIKSLLTALVAVLLAGSAAYMPAEIASVPAPVVAAPDSAGLFPGALGWGGRGWGCTDHKVWRVTTTGTGTGAGTFRAAMDSVAANNSATLCQTITFTVGGNITIGSDVVYTGLRNVRISGQTAQGIVNIIAPNRFRMRRGDGLLVEYLTQRHSYTFSFLTIECVRNLYLRHLSLSWYARDGGANLVMWGCMDSHANSEWWGDITIDRVLAGEPHADHPTCMHVASEQPYPDHRTSRITYYESACLSAGHRFPNAGSRSDSVQVEGFVGYNWVNRAGESADPGGHLDVTNSLWKPGPGTSSANNRKWPWYLRFTAKMDGSHSIYLSGIRSHLNSYALDTPIDSLFFGSQRVIACDDEVTGCAADGDPVAAPVMRGTALSATSHTEATVVPRRALTDARLDSILGITTNHLRSVGNNAYLQCDGTWALRRDSVDTRLIAEFVAGTGASDHLQTHSVRSYGTPAAGTACADADADGLFDEWELSQVMSIASLAPGDVHNGRFAVDWFLAGYGINGRPLGEVERRRRYFARPITYNDGVGWPDLTGIAGPARAWLRPARDSALIITHDSLTVGPGPLSEPDLTALCARWGIPCSRVRSLTVPE